MKNPVCSIIIRARNEEKNIGRLLEGIEKQTIRNVEIILVDSGSTDNTVNIAKKHNAVVVEIEPEKFTFGRSLNHGISVAHSDVCLVASAHVYPVYSDWIEKMMKPFSDPSIALVYGKQRGSDTSQFSEQQIFLHWYGETSQIPQEHPFCNNANSAIRKKFWYKHKYNEDLPGLEDLEWAKWAIEDGYKIGYVSEAEIIHVHEESIKGIFNRYMREGMAFKQIYPHEKFSKRDLFSLFFRNVFSDACNAKERRLLKKQFLNIIKFRWLQFYGTYRGYRRSGPLTWELRKSFYYPRNGYKKPYDHTRNDIDPIDYQSQNL